MALDGRIRILNPTIANTLGLSGETTFVELFSLGWFDLLLWAMQVLVAVWVADKLGQQRITTLSDPSAGAGNPAAQNE